MSMQRDLKATAWATQIWEKAFNEGSYALSYPLTMEGSNEMNADCNLLYNHRRSVRRKKMEPAYFQEWAKMSKVKLTKTYSKDAIVILLKRKPRIVDREGIQVLAQPLPIFSNLRR